MDPIARQIYRAADLRSLGLTRHVVRAQLADGRLQRYAPGLFFVPLQDADERERWLQSAQLHLLTLGPDAMLARSSAAALFDLDGFDRPGTVVECNTAVRSGGARPRRASRRTVPLEPPDRVDGLAVTTIGQTLVELGSTVARSALSPVDRVELALECALHRHLTTLNALSALAEHAGRRRGAAILREALARRPPDAAPTESYLETRMVQLLRHHRLPTPLRQVELHDRFGFIGRVDLVIDNVAIELHGGLHNVGQAIDADRLRRDRLEAAGSRRPAIGCSSSATTRSSTSRSWWPPSCGPRSPGRPDPQPPRLGAMAAPTNTLHYEDTQAEIHKVVVGPYENNVFVLRCKQTGDAVLLDAANEHEMLLELCRSLGVNKVLETHGHFDHIQAVPAVRAAGIDVGIASGDHVLIKETYDFVIDDGDVYQVGKLKLHTIATPGHTPGSMCFRLEGSPILFSGDTLFPGGPGATKFEYANFDTIIRSIEDRLFRPLDAGTLVLPGHGTDTTIGTERPHLDEWVARGW